jgi:SAM-dependent methyltransferase
MSSPSVQVKETCRLCQSRELRFLFALAPTPPANEFLPAPPADGAQDHFPLDVYQCASCGHVQLIHCVDPERLFRNYVYVSGTSQVFVKHFEAYADEVIRYVPLKPGNRVLDIGANDGTLLSFFQKVGMEVLGIDPARKIAEEATRRGIPTWAEFFDSTLAKRIKAEFGTVQVVTANNMFAHADGLPDILDGIAGLLDPNGIFVFEVSYLLDVIERNLFDTIYHEHLSYHSVKPLVSFMRRHGLELVRVQRVDSHGGSIRCYAAPAQGGRAIDPSVAQLIAEEEKAGLYDPATYTAYLARINRLGAELRDLIDLERRDGSRIAGFGAPAKATTLMYQFGLGAKELDYIIDDSPLKQGLYSPGRFVPVVDSSVLADPERRPDYLVILAWNFAPSIIAKNQAYQAAGGKFIVPIPELQIV